MERIPIRTYTLRTNDNWDVTYRCTGDYSAIPFYLDVTAGDGTKLFAASITQTYSSGTGKTTFVVAITETQIGTLTIGNQYFGNFQNGSTKKTWIKLVFNTEIGQTSSAV